MPGQSISAEQMWGIYAAGIAQAAGFSAVPPGFILCGTSLIANLAVSSRSLPPAAVPNMPEALFQVYNLADTALALQGIYSPTQHRFFNDYASYIDNLVPAGSQKAPTPTQAGQLRMLQAGLTDANTQYNTDLNSANAAWGQVSAANPGQYDSFQSFLNGTTWGGVMDADNKKAAAINTHIQTLLNTIYGADYLTIQANKVVVDGVRSSMQGSTATGPYDMLVQATSGSLVVPAYSPSDLDKFSLWVDSIVFQHEGKIVTGVPPAIINFTTGTAKNANINTPYFQQTNWANNHFFFSSPNGNESAGTQLDINTGDPGFSLQVQFDDITQVSLTRGPWFVPALTGSPYVYPNPNILSAATSLLIGMYPQIKMSLDPASYASAYSAYNTAGGFGFGSFWVSASHNPDAANQSMTATWDNTGNAVTIQSSSVSPIILAMIAAPLP